MSGLLWLLFYCPKSIQDFFFKDNSINYKVVKQCDIDENNGFEMV